MDQDKTVMFAELWGHVYYNSGWFRVATDATIFKQSFDIKRVVTTDGNTDE